MSMIVCDNLSNDKIFPEIKIKVIKAMQWLSFHDSTEHTSCELIWNAQANNSFLEIIAS